MSICPFFKVEIKQFVDPQKRQTLDKVLLPPTKIKWCEHPNAPLKKNEKGEIECNGEIGKDDRCPL